jgi:hypothetical protein
MEKIFEAKIEVINRDVEPAAMCRINQRVVEYKLTN